MTEKELRAFKPHRFTGNAPGTEQRVQRLQQELEETKQKLEDRRLMEQEAGSIAEAALRINKVFEAAQQAADQYLENIRQHADRRENESIQHEEA